MTEAYRLCRLKYSPKSGDGAERNGGRWNPPGLPAVYSAAHPSLAILEVTIHFTPEDLPNDYGMTRLEIPTGLMLAVPDADLPHGWDAEEDDQHGPSQKFGRDPMAPKSAGEARFKRALKHYWHRVPV